MENIDNIKQMWNDLNRRLESVEQENQRLANNIMRSNLKSTREKLIGKYKKFIFVEFIMFLSVGILIYNGARVEIYKIPALITWEVFFLAEAFLDYYLMNRLQNIDIYTSPLCEISSIAQKNWKIHRIAIIAGLPFALVCVALFALCLGSDKFILLGILVGFIVGSIIGVLELRKFIKYYKELQNNNIT